MISLQKIIDKILPFKKEIDLDVSDAQKQIIGIKGEKVALKFLWKKGYRILAKNIYLRSGEEIDILAIKNGVLCFVEVRTRKFFDPQYPEDAIDKRKINAMKTAAKRFLTIHKIQKHLSRIDLVICVRGEKNNKWQCHLIEGVVPFE